MTVARMSLAALAARLKGLAVARAPTRAAARAESPFAHLMLEPHRRTPDAPVEFAVRARCWPGGDDRLLGVCSPHGPPVTWE